MSRRKPTEEPSDLGKGAQALPPATQTTGTIPQAAKTCPCPGEASRRGAEVPVVSPGSEPLAWIGGFQMNSDLVRAVTKDCSRQDCQIIFKGSTNTLMAWSPVYDRNGNRIDSGDPNISTHFIRCRVCGREWVAETQYGTTSVSELQDQPTDCA